MNMNRKQALQYLLECGEPLGFMLGDLEDDFNFLCDKAELEKENVDYLEIANYLLEPDY
jgi:hypothetical protein